MSIRIKQLAITLLIRSLRGIRAFGRVLWALLVIVSNPFVLILKIVFKPIVLRVYRVYLQLMARLKRTGFMQNKVLFIFGNKYFIHVIIVMIAFFVASTNVLQAQEPITEDFGTQSGLYEIVNPDGGLAEDIVEEGLIQRTTDDAYYIETDGLLVANIPELDPNAEPLRTIGEELQQLESKSGTAFVSNSALETSSGIRADFIEYEVREGDSIGSLANRFGLTVNTLLWANDLTSTSFIRPGDTIAVPPVSGYTVEIESGDTLQKLVEKHEGDFDETVKLLGTETIPVGDTIVIVDGEPYVPPQPVVTSVASSGSSSSSSGNLFQNRNVAPAPVSSGNLQWPVGCRSAATTYWGHGLARDISCPFGTPIYAAHDGVFSVGCSGHYCGGYGNYARVSGGGYQTLYAHLSSFNVGSGASVSRGQVIGFVGSTGRSTGPHLHIEVWAGGVKQEPLNYIR